MSRWLADDSPRSLSFATRVAVFAGAMVWRFVRTGGPAMLKMMG